ncbi:16S rRNA (guanine(527)-N(7))-methyltransferase RsmG [Desulfovibrio sp. TomC]|uniref:16S rRNA (guanine(527)-N(7))-methyltransferase RsmG n=1 Tax=Desulfovibrio sp. TomC TaxID=1562888 RepID=UPI000574BD31|nr:RsmG family class I SAM-dependent methyltransferase [Desulfovibrio sp. TomC]KHK04192.1 rRNA small subunit 7-methylguanosine (m7G) methyltransferase GidB [Desulfovibrio sp. TomC]
MRQGLTGPDAPAVRREAARLGRELLPEQAGLLAGYLALLGRWSSKVNLVGPSQWQDVLETLVADSWHVADFLAGPGAGILPMAGQTLLTLDFGAGAGLPGIPLRAFWNRGDYVLLEARQKRSVFLGEAVARLGLAGMSVAEGRVEATAPPILAARPEAFVLCISRAFAPWPQFLGICRGLVRRPMAVLTMTGSPTPATETPPEFAVAATGSYAVAGKPRYMSLFTPSAASI